ncbi:MAG: portal protein [Candidatus Poseidoniales archaeon]
MLRSKEEFDNVVSMLAFNELGHDIFRRWYIDGRLYHHLVVNEQNLKGGIQEIRPIDSSKIRKVKQVKKKKDPATNASIIEKVDEYYIYQEKPTSGANISQAGSGVKLSLDSVSYVTSGLLDESRKKVLSFLHKALKPLNQLRMMEDSLFIYRLARAPERRILYIDVGNLPRGKAEQYMKDIMTRYRNKLVYDSQTGEIKDDRKHQSMLEDFWLPRREGGRGTEISTLPGGENLGQIDDIVYFQKRLYRALNVPINRLEQEAQFSLGRSTEISRDELKFQKFIGRLRTRFSSLFLDILKVQLQLKGIITEEDWGNMKNDIAVDYIRDNHFTELKEMEILRERVQTLDMVNNYVDQYFSREWIMKNVLQFTDEDIEQLAQQSSDESGDEQQNDEEQ